MRVGLVGLVMLLALSRSDVRASLCQTINVSTSYPHQASPGQRIQLVTNVKGSCTSDGENYFAARVDLADNASKSVLASNSTPIGYNANNFSVNVENFATTPSNNGTWPIDINTYVLQAGGASGNYLVNATTVAIQVGDAPLPEYQQSPMAIFILALSAVPLILRLRERRKGDRRMLRYWCLIR